MSVSVKEGGSEDFVRQPECMEMSPYRPFASANSLGDFFRLFAGAWRSARQAMNLNDFSDSLCLLLSPVSILCWFLELTWLADSTRPHVTPLRKDQSLQP
jgi:hypothetical protein